MLDNKCRPIECHSIGLLNQCIFCLCLATKVKSLDDKDGIGNDVVGRAKRAKHLLEMVDCSDANSNTPLSEAASELSV